MTATRGPARRWWLLLVATGAVLATVLLARSGTAVDDAVVAEVRASATAEDAGRPGPTAPDAPAVVPDGRVVVRADGVDGLRLGMTRQEVVSAGFVVGGRSYGPCTPVVPGLADRGPGQGVRAWLVRDRVAAVTVDDRVGDAASFLGPGPGDPLAELDGVPGVLFGDLRVAVPWEAAPFRVDVAWVRPTQDVRVAFVDTRGDGTVGHVEVRSGAAADCARLQRDAQAADAAALPVLEPGGWGEVRLGRPLAEVPTTVRLQREAVTGQGCELVLADEQPGLVLVVLRDGVVVAVTVDEGEVVGGARVGDPAEDVRDAVGPSTSYLLQFWEQGLSADWQVPDGAGGTVRVVLRPALERVPVPDVDAVLVGPRPVLGSVELGDGC